MNNIIENLVCPITKQVFRNPVTLCDGITYEYLAIKEWLEKTNKSPITNQPIILNDSVSIVIKNTIDELENNNLLDSQLRHQEYTINKKKIIKKFNYSLFEKMSECEKKNYLDTEDLECIDNNNWRPIHYICKFSTPEMIKYIIDKGVDLECKTNENWRPIHYICSYSTPEMIKYIIDKGAKSDYFVLTNSFHAKVRKIFS